MNPFLLAFFLVFIAETGDKTQFVALTFAARYRLPLVMAAVAFATLIIHLLSVTLGEVAGRLVPGLWINLLSGCAFIGFGLWTLLSKSGSDKENDEQDSKHSRLGPFLAIALTFFVAELGDKTMLATFTIASQQHSFLAVWLGSSLGMFTANLIPMLVGRFMAERIPQNVLRYASAMAFFSAGAFTFVRAI